MKLRRTPDDRFIGLPGYDFAPNYADVDGPDGPIRMHYLDEAPSGAAESGKVIVLLHGEPSWSYLYRTMIPILTAAGHRCIAPDLVGFGRSDKPSEPDDYTVARHVEWVRQLLFDRLGLADIVVFGQDWGGTIALRLAGEHPERFASVIVGNTGIPTGHNRMPDALLQWQRFARETEVLPIGNIVQMGCNTMLDPAVIAAYEAPFPDESFKAGARQFPTLIATTPDTPASAGNLAAFNALASFERPFLSAFSDGDPLSAGVDRLLIGHVPGAAGQPHTTIEDAGHFLQEDRGPELANVIVDFLG